MLNVRRYLVYRRNTRRNVLKFELTAEISCPLSIALPRLHSMKTKRFFFDIFQPCAGNSALNCAVILAFSMLVTDASVPLLSAQQVATPVKVMSFNIRFGSANDGDNHWDRRHHLVLETIKVADPDLLGLQEALAFQCDYLKEQLPGYEFFGRGREAEADKGEFCGILFRSERFEKMDGGHFWLSETPNQAGSKSWDAALPRMVTWVQLKERTTNKEFIFANTHFDHRGRQARLNSAKLIRSWMDERAETPIVLTGDFNAGFQSEPWQAMIGDSPAFTDTYRQTHATRKTDEGTFGGWTGKQNGPRIDWIVHSPGFQTVNASINYHNHAGQYPSDHYPVQAVVMFASDAVDKD